jgi:CheY-like chemotaxis protein
MPGQAAPPKKILVADDDPVVATTIRMALSADHHEVDLARNGEEGLTKFYSGDHDLVITDFRMANMNGLEFAEVIKKLSPETPVILITAYLEEVEIKMGNVSNVDLLLSKPLSVTQLQAAIAKVLAPG